MYDVIIIGGGPAGLAAAIYCARANLRTLVLDKGESALLRAHVIENYFGIESIEGKKLLEIGSNQAMKFGAEMKNEEVLGIQSSEKGYVVECSENKYEGKYIILAVGTRRTKPNIKNLDDFEGKGVSYCATCDAFFFKGKTVGVIGHSDYTLKEALELKEHASKVFILTNGEDLNISEAMKKHIENFEIINKKVAKCIGSEKLEEIEFEDGEKLKLHGLFIALDPSSPKTLTRKIGIEIEKGIIKVDSKQRTNIQNIYAIGDCANIEKQVGVAVGEGIRAALDIIRSSKHT